MFGEFSQPPEDEVREARWEGWTPPWMGPEGGHGPGGPGRGFGGPWRGWGHRGWRGPFFGPGRHWGMPDELLALRTEAAEVARLFAIASRGALGNRERLSQLRAFLDRSRKELAEMIYGSSARPANDTGENAGSSADMGQA